MPKPLRRLPGVESPFVLRAELLTLVPHSMSTIDRLEAEGKFPGRIRLEPTNRVAWLRREVTGYLRHLAKRRQSEEDHVNQELVARSKESGPTPVARHIRFDDQDKRALRALDNDFTISTDGETATVGGEMEVVIVRPPDDGGARFWLTIRLPGGEELDVQIARAQLLQQLDIDADESLTEIDLRNKNRRRSI